MTQNLCHLCGQPLNLTIEETPGGVHPSCANYEAALDAARNEEDVEADGNNNSMVG